MLQWNRSYKNNNKCRVTFSTNGKREFVYRVTKFSLFLSLTVHYFYIKLSSFTRRVLSIRIVLSRCYRLISCSIFAYSRTLSHNTSLNHESDVCRYKRESKSIKYSLYRRLRASAMQATNLSDLESRQVLKTYKCNQCNAHTLIVPLCSKNIPSVFTVYPITI